ncbi:MAG: hypothetical protein LC114_21345, partial [Bryobacterales bacterium]|nr:hypothetical protein [Bryobacterales bacterium]
MSKALRSIAKYSEQRAEFRANTVYRNTFGAHFQGVDSPWDDFHQIALWYEQVFVALPDHQAESAPFRHVLFDGRTERLKAMKAATGNIEEFRTTLERIVSRVTDLSHAVPSQRSRMEVGSFDEILGCLGNFMLEVSEALETIAKAGINEDLQLRNVPPVLVTAGQCRNAIAAVAAAEENLKPLLGGAYRGVDTDLEPILHTTQFAESIAASVLPERTAQWLLCPEHRAKLSQMRAWLRDAAECG